MEPSRHGGDATRSLPVVEIAQHATRVQFRLLAGFLPAPDVGQLGLVGEVLQHRLVVGEFTAFVGDQVDPLLEDGRVFVEGPFGVVADESRAEMRVQEDGWVEGLQHFDVRETLLEVEVRGRRGRPDPFDVGDPDAGGIGDEDRVVCGIFVDDLMGGVAGCRVDSQFVCPEIDMVPVLDRDDPVLGDGFGFDVVVPLVADGRLRPRDQSGGVGDVIGPQRGDVDVGVRTVGGEKAGPAGVIEVDVRQRDDREVLAVDADLGERLPKQVVVRTDARIDDGRAVIVEDVNGTVAAGFVHSRIEVVAVRTVAGGDLADVSDCHIETPSWDPIKARVAATLGPEPVQISHLALMDSVNDPHRPRIATVIGADMSHDTPASSRLVGTPLWLERSSLPWLVTAFGGLSIAGLVGWWLAFADTIGATAYLTTLLSIGVPAVGLGWGGHRLTESDIDESRYGRVCKWCFGGAVAFLAVNMLSIVFFPADSVAANTTWAHFALNTGAVGGFAVGYVEARAIQREVEATAATVRARQLEDEQELLAYLNDLLRHEVLNSSQIIGGHATLLQAECDREAVRDRLETIERESDNLVGVIEDVRAMLDANRGPQSGTAVDLVAVLEAQLLEYRTRFDDVDIEADLPETAHVSANEGVKWIFANLLENAIEHNEGRARVRVTAERGPETVVVRVADDGPGIAEADRETLFERRSTNHGLGLYLSRILANRYGGGVELVETGPDGSVFGVTLQRAASTDADVDAAERSQ